LQAAISGCIYLLQTENTLQLIIENEEYFPLAFCAQYFSECQTDILKDGISPSATNRETAQNAGFFVVIDVNVCDPT
jgi:hypothetical protein